MGRNIFQPFLSPQIHEGDNRVHCPTGVADRVNLGLIPAAEMSYPAACAALKRDTGGVLHIHHNVKRGDDFGQRLESFTGRISEGEDFRCKHEDWRLWSYATAGKIAAISESMSDRGEIMSGWTVTLLRLTRVKSYAPRVDHLVLDLRCNFQPRR